MINSSSLGKRFVISIGINAHPLDPTAPLLLHAEDDARAFDAHLRTSDIPQTQRTLLLGQQATCEAIYAELERLLANDPGKQDMVLFYYAGYVLPLLKHVLEDVGHVQLDALLAAADLDNLLLATPDDLPLPGMHTLRNQFIDRSQAQHQFFILDCHYPDAIMPDEQDWISERLRQLMQCDLPGHGSLLSWTSAQQANDPQHVTQRFSFSILEALRDVSSQARQYVSLTAQSLYAYICAHQPSSERHPTLSYTSPSDFVIIPASKRTKPLQPMTESNKTDGETYPPEGEQTTRLDPVPATLPLPPLIEPSVSTGPINVFICSSRSREDEKFLEKLHTHLHPLAARGIITYWDKTKIKPGLKWQEETEQAIAAAQVAILLVSVDLFHSDMHDELSRLMQRAEDGNMALIPVSIRDVLLDGTSLQKFHFLNEQPLNDLKASQRDRIWTQVVSTIIALR